MFVGVGAAIVPISFEALGDDCWVFAGSGCSVPRAEPWCPSAGVWWGFAGRDGSAGYRVDAHLGPVHGEGVADGLAGAVAEDRGDLLIGMALGSQVRRDAEPFFGPFGSVDLGYQLGGDGAVFTKTFRDAIFVHVELVADGSEAHAQFAQLNGSIPLLII